MRPILRLLSKIPGAGSIVRWVGSNVRLMIEYIMLGLLLAVAGAAITLWFKAETLESKTDELTRTVEMQEIVNESQTNTIEWLSQVRQRDVDALESVAKNYKDAEGLRKNSSKRRALLESNDALVNHLLNQPVPPSLNCMYNPSTCKKASDRVPGSSAPSSADKASSPASRARVGSH